MPRINYEVLKEEAKKADLEILAREMWEAWAEEHKKQYPEVHSGSHPVKLPSWEEINDEIKLCWIAAAKCAMGEYIS